MNDPRLDILDWPQQLSRVLDDLEQGTHQDFREMQMDDGFMSRRPTGAPEPIFKTTMSLSQAEEAALMEFFHTSHGRHFSFRYPKTQSQVYAAFMKIPFTRRRTINVGSSHTSHEVDVDIVLRDATHLIEEALSHGVVSRSNL